VTGIWCQILSFPTLILDFVLGVVQTPLNMIMPIIGKKRCIPTPLWHCAALPMCFLFRARIKLFYSGFLEQGFTEDGIWMDGMIILFNQLETQFFIIIRYACPNSTM